MRRQAIIIGAGPAGLTAALELLRRTDVVPVILEASNEIGGISRTVRYKGNRMDIGGHRFFSKSERVMQWWMDLMPPEMQAGKAAEISYQGKQRLVSVPALLPEEPVLRGSGPLHRVPKNWGDEDLETGGEAGGLGEERVTVLAASPERDPDLVMLIRPRKSRIYYLRRFFDYPIRITAGTLSNLGVLRTIRVGVSYFRSRFRKISPERSLEDFLINRFGRELYLTFFKSYTEKVWGTPCDRISAEWGAQRIRGLSLMTAVKHFLRGALRFGRRSADLSQRQTDTSLIERFLYPKFGPGQMWEHVAEQVKAMGGEIHMGCKVDCLRTSGGDRAMDGERRITAVESISDGGERRSFAGDYIFSTMPVRDLIRAMDGPVPKNVEEVSDGLEYRDFITVGLLADRLKAVEPGGGLLKDTWIYVQEPDVLLGRLQVFNNWSPHLLADPTKVWIGLEYFCYETDALWRMTNEEIQSFAIAEVAKIGILDPEDVRDGHVVRVPKTYPAYFGTYDRFHELREFTDLFENLILIGRNGMHKYNNQDHSMLTAMTAVDGIAAGRIDRAALWEINTEQDYQEERR